MFKLINVSLNHGRMRENVRSRLVETCDGLVFSWGAASSRKDARQSACRVQLTARGLAWDSGWVQTTEQSLRYGGEELPQATPIALSICIRDDAGEYSETYRNTFYNADVAWRAPFIGGGTSIAVRCTCERSFRWIGPWPKQRFTPAASAIKKSVLTA